jgi:L-alanine-DL-glutamate epimerase-like enolase superfamily enzyme
MKITDVKVTVFRSTACTTQDHIGHQHPAPTRPSTVTLTAIETDEGVTGYALSQDVYYTVKPGVEIPAGPISASLKELPAEKPKAATNANPILGKVKPVIVGMDPFEREKIYHMLYKMQRSNYNSSVTDSVLKTVDSALWDLFGRYCNLPLYKVLGGHRTKVSAYASTMVGDHFKGGLGSPEDYANFAKACVDEGYRAVKLHTWADDDWSGDNVYGHPDVNKDIECCKAVREAVGPDIELMVDCFHYYDRYDALKLGRALQDLGYLWYEEPMEEYNIDSYKWLKSKLDIPIIGPEVMKGKYWTRAEWIKNGVCDIVRTGLGDVGGITPVMKTVHTCESFNIPCEIHSRGAGSLHVMAAMTVPGRYYERGMLHPFLEYNNTPPWLNKPIDVMDSEGYVAVPQDPGFGYDLNWDYINENKL